MIRYTHSTPIQKAEDMSIVYNDQLQITEYDTQIVETRSLKSSVTTKKVKP